MRPRSILCIDDDSQLIQALTQLFEFEGYQVCSTSLVATALELMHLMRPELIILDISMPDMSGFEVLKRIKATTLGRSIPVIILSGQYNERNVEHMKALGAAEFLSKPLEPSHLLARVNSVWHQGQEV